METLKCKRCGYEWIPRTKNPVLCPRCKSKAWNEIREDRKKEPDLKRVELTRELKTNQE